MDKNLSISFRILEVSSADFEDWLVLASELWPPEVEDDLRELRQTIYQAVMVPLLSELGLPGMDVESYRVVEDGLILDVEVYPESACCPRCGTISCHLHQNHWHLVQDLPISHYRKT